MSKPSLTGREQQQSSPFGLGQKRAKKAKKIRRKCAVSAPYFSRVTIGGVLNMPEVKIVGRGVDTLVINVCSANEHFQPVKQELAKGGQHVYRPIIWV